MADFFDLTWFVIDESQYAEITEQIYKQIFIACPLAGLSNIKVNVRREMRGSWFDAAQGYLMLVDYKVAQEEC